MSGGLHDANGGIAIPGTAPCPRREPSLLALEASSHQLARPVAPNTQAAAMKSL